MKAKSIVILSAVILCGFGAAQISAQTYASAPPNQVLWFAGDGDARDSSGSGSHATPASGMNAPTYLVGKVGQDFSLNGFQYASIPDSAAIRPPSLTVEGWAKLDVYNNTAPTVFSKALGTGSSDSYVVWYQDGVYRGAICSDSGCAVVTAPSTSGGWHHVALTFNDPGGAAAKTIAFYLDGVLVSSDTTGLAVGYDTHPALIGADFAFESIGYGWTGELGEISLYNRALSAAEIQSINNAGISGKIKQAATVAGANSNTQIGDATISFANVSVAGTTSDYTIDPTTAGTLPTGYTNTGLAYDISTNAVYSGSITECFHIPAVSDATVFGKLKVLHSEGGTLVDKTITANFTTRSVCGRTASLSPFVIANGLAPTAASVAVGGRVFAGNSGLAQARLTLTNSNGETRSVSTNSFGYYRFSGVAAGETYVLSVVHKRYTFAPRVIGVTEAMSELNFTADSR